MWTILIIQVIAQGAARRYALRRWQFDSRRIHVRPRTGPQSAHGYAASSQRAYSLRQLRARPQQQTHHCCCRSTGQTDALQTDGQTDGHWTVLIRSQRTMWIVLPPQPSFSSSGLFTDTSEHIRFFCFIVLMFFTFLVVGSVR